MKTIHFNTGRLYSANGQRITATLRDNGMVTFNDHDRHVDGEFKLCGSRFDAAVVMHAYDHNIAKQSHQSWQDGMLRDGCNSKYEG